MPVCMKEILQSKAWHEAGAEIPIVLGKEASGRPLVADLTKMPHLLVAGSTGSGKTDVSMQSLHRFAIIRAQKMFGSLW